MPAFLAGARFTPDPLAPLGERVTRGGVSISHRGPGEGLVPFHTDILALIPLIAAGILAYLSLPPHMRRS
jgi:hypothetical protein